MILIFGRKIVQIPGIVLSSQNEYTNAALPPRDFLHFSIQLNPAAFLHTVMQNGTISVACKFDLCLDLDLPSDTDRCSFGRTAQSASIRYGVEPPVHRRLLHRKTDDAGQDDFAKRKSGTQRTAYITRNVLFVNNKKRFSL